MQVRLISANTAMKPYIAKRLLHYATKEDMPTIFCFQEARSTFEEILKHYSYKTTKTLDFERSGRKDLFVTTAIPEKFDKNTTKEFTYFHEGIQSIWHNIYYRFLAKMIEHHQALVTDVTLEHGDFLRIINVHLSASAAPEVRLKSLGQVLSYVIPGKTIVCGDLNIAENKIYIRGTGWLRGYKKKDYLIRERTVVNDIIKDMNYINVFQNKNTTRHPIRLQFDHILLPQGISLLKSKLLKFKGTDHHACLVEIEL